MYDAVQASSGAASLSAPDEFPDEYPYGIRVPQPTNSNTLQEMLMAMVADS